ncbi:hypothetical protein WJX79_007639 [Trebouxia sp. C0005]
MKGCLALMHSKGVVHADIKPENILLTSPPESGNVGVKLIDLGNCFSLTGTDTSRISFEMQTLPFRAPEALTGGACGAGIDVWSLGCVLAEVALQRPLFPITTISELMHQMTAQLGPLPPSLRSLLPAQASPIMVAQAAPPIHESAHKGTDSVQTSRWAHGQQNPIPGHAQDAEQDPGEESVQGLQQTLGQSAQGAVQTPGVVRAWNGVTRLLQEMTPGSEIRPPPPNEMQKSQKHVAALHSKGRESRPAIDKAAGADMRADALVEPVRKQIEINSECKSAAAASTDSPAAKRHRRSRDRPSDANKPWWVV